MTTDPNPPRSETSRPSSPTMGTGSGTFATLPFKPPTPKYGGISEVGSSSWAAWTGGRPMADWSGPEDPKPATITPNQYRPTSISNQAKSLVYRIQGLDTKFTRGSDLLTFQKKVMKHLIKYGLDTVTYIEDPIDQKLLTSVVNDHARFNLKVGVAKGNYNLATHYDSYELANDEDAKQFLLNSVDDELETQLYENCKDKDSFVAYWLNLIHLVRSVSIDRFDKIKDRIKARQISTYSGENVESIVTDYLTDWHELHGAGLYDQNLTMTMLNAIMEAGGNTNEDFRHPLRDIKLRLNRKLLEVRHLSYADAHQAMVSDELDVQSVTKAAKEQYRELYDSSKWPASAHAKDSKAMNRNYGSVNMASTDYIAQVVNSLIQSSNGPKRDKSKDSCNNCGKQGHWARDCPEKKNRQFNSRDKSARNNPGRNGTRRNGPTDRPPPPKDGESEIKFINKKKNYWCERCNRWTLSHGTDGHKTKEELQSERPAAGMARVDFNLHPSAFMVKGPMMNPTKTRADTVLHYLGEAIKWSLALTWIWYLSTQTIFVSSLVSWLNIIWSLLPVALEQLKANWIALIMTAGSGAIGFGAAAKLYESIDEPTVRYRSGPNVVKQARRKWKWNKGIRPNKGGRRNSVVPPQTKRVDLINHPRFNNIARPNRLKEPKTERIRYVRARIESLQNEIRRVEKYLKVLVQEEQDQQKLLLSLEGKHHPHASCKQRRTCKPMKHSREQKVIKKKPHMTVCYDEVKCAMLNLVNLSQVSSSLTRKYDNETVLFDSGANCCITHKKEDFVGEFDKQAGIQTVDGIGKGLRIEGSGKVAWTFKADNGNYRTIKVPCYYIPSANARIASLQEILKVYPKEKVTMTGNALTLSGSFGIPSVSVPYCASSNLPMASLKDHTAKVYKSQSRRKKPDLPTSKQPSLTRASNINLSEPEKELLRWHCRLGHVGMKRIQWLFRQGILSTSEKTRRLQEAASKLTHGPLCTACQYAKQRRKTMPGTTKHTIKKEVGTLKRNDLFPGQEISIDHFVCNPLGRLLNTYGKESSDSKYRGGCIFVDHSSGYTHVELQSSLNSHATLTAKKQFDEMCASHGVIPQQFLSDNGSSFVNKDFEAHLSDFHQSIRHSGVGAHHSNGIAERGISTLLSIARAMLHHSAIHWPDVADVTLWPLAVLHAAYLLNRIPREDSGRSPLELFSRKTWSSSKFHDLHTWGCPVYVLDSTLSDGNKIPRWKPRSGRCMYVGNSVQHGHAIPLVLNLDTGKITPQYHVVFDDWFQTVDSSVATQVDFDQADWYQTFGLTESQYVPDGTQDEPMPDVAPTIDSEGAVQLESARNRRDALWSDTPTTPPPFAATKPALPGSLNQREYGSAIQREWEPEPLPLPSKPLSPPIEQPKPQSAQGWFDVDERESVPTPLAASRREATLASPPPLQREKGSNQPQAAPPRAETTRDVSNRDDLRRSRRAQGLPPSAMLADDHSHHYDTLYVGKAANTDPDNYTWDQAMESPHREKFLEAAQAEIDALVDKGTWYEDLKSNATTPIIPSQWVFRVKRTPDGAIKKFKGRAVLRGDLQADNGESNFSPVASWSTVRSFLVISAIRGWVTTTIDFSNAFVQSELPADDPVWMHVPRGFKTTKGSEYCLKLVKSLYGHKRAPLLWFNHSTDAFKKLGFKQSKHDPCLWYGDDIMMVQYVDDCGISAPSQARIDQFVADLRQMNFELTQEGSFSEFLGIKFETLPNGSVECTQKGLIDKTLEAAGMTDCNPNSVPAAQAGLGADKDGPPMEEKWNYRGICGMLLYLSTNTRPDIAFAVSQVCRFGHAPKKSHATAVKTILRYLKKTSNKGIIVKPSDNTFNLDLYVDADFCGLFGQEDPRDANSVRSRTGYIVILCGWPIIWKSQLQSHLSQSTLEAEYSALSSSLRVFLPLKWLIEEMIAETKCQGLNDTRLHATVFEDNQSTYYLATNQRITSRTKYLCAKWHWFWSEYNKKNSFSIIKCPTDQQYSDFLTKSQPRLVFETNRMAVQGCPKRYGSDLTRTETARPRTNFATEDVSRNGSPIVARLKSVLFGPHRSKTIIGRIREEGVASIRNITGLDCFTLINHGRDLTNQCPQHLKQETHRLSFYPLNSTMTNTTASMEDYPTESVNMVLAAKRPHAGGAGLGIVLVQQDIASVWTNNRGDLARFNEPQNDYGKYLLSLLMTEMRKRKDNPNDNKSGDRVGESDCFKAVIKVEAERLQDDSGYDEEDFTSRRIKVTWSVMAGFGGKAKYNVQLRLILIDYAQARLGYASVNGDEIEAAVYAIKKYYRSVIKDNQNSGKGSWCLPILHLLNGHMKQFGVTPLCFRPKYEEDVPAMEEARKEHCKTIWKDAKPIMIEARKDVVDQLVQVLRGTNQFNYVTGPVADEGEPKEPEEEEDLPPPKRARRSFGSA